MTTAEPRLAQALRYLRLRAQLTQQAVCELVRASGGELSAIYLSMLERGRRNPSPEMLDRLLAALHSDRAELTELYREQPWMSVRSMAASSAPRMRPHPPTPSASAHAQWSDNVTVASRADTSFDELAELWPRISHARRRELVRLARGYAK